MPVGPNMSKAIDEGHWGAFLDHRKALIHAAVKDGESLEAICQRLSLDNANHVRRIYEATKEQDSGN